MGCCCSCCKLCGGFEVNEDIEGQDRESLSDMKRLGLDRGEINTFFRAFKKVDRMKQDCILISDLLRFLGINEVPLTMGAFGELDLSTDGMLNFREFTLSSWIFCARRQEGISDMAFSMYDKNDSGDLTTNEISTMVKECYGQISEEHNVWSILEKFDTNRDSKVSRNEFVIMCKKHPIILHPALNFQSKLKNLISSSKKFWNKIYMTSNKTMHSKRVKMLFRIPDKIDSARDLLAKQVAARERAGNSTHVKGFSYDQNLGVVNKVSAGGVRKRGQDKWKVDKDALKPKKKKQVVVHDRRKFGLFD